MESAQRRRDERNKIKELAQGFAISSIGEAFFDALAQHLANTLEVDYAFIGELTQQNRSIRSVAFYANGHLLDTLEYPLAGSVCEHVVKKPAFCAFVSGVQQQFPYNQALKRFGVDSYLGKPLIDTFGKVMGLIYVMHRGPITNPELTQDLLSIVARRAELEMERRHQDSKLQAANQLLTAQNLALQKVNQELTRVQGKLLELKQGLESQVASRTRQLSRNQLLLRRSLVRTLHLNKNLRERERQLQLLTDALPVLISYVDAEERYQFVNRTYQEWFGVAPDDMLGQTVRHVVGETAYQLLQPYIHAALTGQEQHFESVVTYQIVGQRFVDVHYIPHVSQGRVLGCYALVTDISERKGAEEQLRSSNRQLSLINDDLDNFVYAASHDLKGPIANIEGLMHLLTRRLAQKEWQDETIRETIKQIDGSVKRFKGTIVDLTEVTKIQRGLDQDREAVSFLDILGEVLLDLRQPIQESGVKIAQHLMACGKLMYPRKHLQSIIYNLLSNAIKYRSLNRQLEVEVSCWETEQHLVFSVKDNGLGMNMRDPTKIFALFKRLHTHVEGTGIGLYIVKKIVESQGGHIEVESQEGMGSIFRVFFEK